MAQSLIAHIEIPSTDINKSQEFFKNVFGWEFKPFGKDYSLFNNYQGITAGLRQVKDIIKGNSTVFHLNVESIDDVLEKAKKHGGDIKTEKTIIPAMGWYALIFDPDGNTIGLYQKN